MKKDAKHSYFNNGFTAVELLITLFVASIFLFTGYQLYAQVIRDGQEAANLSEMSNVTYERLLSEAASASQLVSGACTTEPAPTTSQSNVPGIGTVTYTTTITCPRGTAAAADLFLIKVRAAYTHNGSQQVLEHATYVTGDSTAVAATPINYSDDFLSSGALGTVKTGTPAVTWEFLNSTSSNWTRNSGGFASSTTAASSNPMAIANVGKADVSITEGVRSTGNAIYFRVVDATNWLRLRVNYDRVATGTSTYYTSYLEYQVRNEPTWYSNGGPIASTANQAITNCQNQGNQMLASGSYTAWRGCNSAVQSTSTNYSYYYYLILDKSVNGTISTLDSQSLGSLPAFIKVIAKGSSIQTFYGSTSATTSSSITANDGTNSTATKHGIGYAASSYNSPTGVTSITITDAP